MEPSRNSGVEKYNTRNKNLTRGVYQQSWVGVGHCKDGTSEIVDWEVVWTLSSMPNMHMGLPGEERDING